MKTPSAPKSDAAPRSGGSSSKPENFQEKQFALAPALSIVLGEYSQVTLFCGGEIDVPAGHAVWLDLWFQPKSDAAQEYLLARSVLPGKDYQSASLESSLWLPPGTHKAYGVWRSDTALQHIRQEALRVAHQTTEAQNPVAVTCRNAGGRIWTIVTRKDETTMRVASEYACDTPRITANVIGKTAEPLDPKLYSESSQFIPRDAEWREVTHTVDMKIQSSENEPLQYVGARFNNAGANSKLHELRLRQ